MAHLPKISQMIENMRSVGNPELQIPNPNQSPHPKTPLFEMSTWDLDLELGICYFPPEVSFQ
jgi:hypothetical protein